MTGKGSTKASFEFPQRRPGSKRKLRAAGEALFRCRRRRQSKGSPRSYRPQNIRQEQGLERFLLPRPCRLVVERVSSLASQLGIRETLSGNLGHG